MYIQKECVICKRTKDLKERTVEDVRSFYKYGASVSEGQSVHICIKCVAKIFGESKTFFNAVLYNDETLDRIVNVSYAATEILETLFYKEGKGYSSSLIEIQEELSNEYLQDVLNSSKELTEALLYYYRQPNETLFYLERKYHENKSAIDLHIDTHVKPIVEYYKKYYTSADRHKVKQMKSFD